MLQTLNGVIKLLPAILISAICCDAMSQVALGDSLIGRWRIEGSPRLLSPDSSAAGWIEHGYEDMVTFYQDGVFEIQSGIFFPTPKKWPEFAYPWIYCGNFSYYKVTKKILQYMILVKRRGTNL